MKQTFDGDSLLRTETRLKTSKLINYMFSLINGLIH